MKLRYPIILFLTAIMTTAAAAQSGPRRVSVAFLNFGDGAIAHSVLERLSASLTALTELSVVDREQARMAARGIGYTGSLNMTLQEARDLGAAIGCDYY